MGLFDHIAVEVALPDGQPAPGPCKTKSLPEPCQEHYRLDADGQLWLRLRRFADAEAGEAEVPYPHFGMVEFVTSEEQGYKEYTAAIAFGRLLGIRVGREDAWERTHGPGTLADVLVEAAWADMKARRASRPGGDDGHV